MIPQIYKHVLRWAFARFYREFAWTYDAVAWIVSRGLWRHWIAAVVPYLQAQRVLEVGCGTGYLQRTLREQNIAAVGLDASPQMLQLAQRKVAAVGLRASLLRGHAQHLPFPNAVFSDVVATFPAEYIVEQATIREAYRVLQSGGQLVLVDAAQLTQHDAYAAAVDIAYRATGQVRFEDPRPRLVAAAGFTVHEQWVDVEASRVQLLIGIKPGASPRPAD